MSKTLVIYHRADFDGIFCREIANKFIPDATLAGWDYGDPENPVSSDFDQIYMLDINVPGLMSDPRVIWIDHHKSAIDKFPLTIPGYRIDGVAACRLSWQWFVQHDKLFHPTAGSFAVPLPDKADFIDRKVQEPLAVRLAGEYDIWDRRDSNAELFQHGLRTRDLTAPEWGDRSYWEVMLSETMDAKALVNDLLASGKYLQFAKAHENESIIKELGFTLKWEGLTFLACNAARYNSLLFTAGLTPEHDACFGFKWTGTKWSVSLYHAPGKEHHDLSQIAVRHGGGGHRGACGFQTNILPFTMPFVI